ncbi:MAG: phosphatase PAP2 family protein [Chitinophaga sp.]|uniref:phosphatase PAP2 family protein n=1 Tax=Chitinophaga sp. TaxID=1869181 RepID=UPI0025BFEDB7|nr:phosphatase PAP2 family protein [Chitinophaga sp.]MBV8251126.1 phosphatase PAP2 family protein [Chitinophaga sp.]
MNQFQKVYQSVKYFIWAYLPLLALLIGIKLTHSREDIYFFINSLHTGFGDWFFPKVTHLGSTGAAVTLVVVLFFINKRESFVLATAYCFTSLVGFFLKFMVAFPRPHRYFEQLIHKANADPRIPHIYYVPGVDVLDNFRSFPSGHTICAFTAATVLAHFTKNKVWSLVFLLLAILVGYSRMYMSQHFFEDVTAGSAVGVFLTMAWLAYVDGKGFAAGMKP